MTIQKKIANKIKEKKGLTLIGILLGAVAFGLLAIPMARWVISMTETVATNERKVVDIGIQLEMQSALEDRWHIINDMSIDQLKAATTKTTTYGKYTVKEEYKAAGKYNTSTGACVAGTPSASEQVCREVTMTVTGPAGTTPLGPVVAIRAATPSERMAALETKAANLETKVAAAQSTADTAKKNAATAQSTADTAKTNAATAQSTANTAKANAATAQSTANTANSNANSALSKFGSYYTKTQVDSKISGSGVKRVFVSGDYSCGEDTCYYFCAEGNSGKKVCWDGGYMGYYGGYQNRTTQ